MGIGLCRPNQQQALDWRTRVLPHGEVPHATEPRDRHNQVRNYAILVGDLVVVARLLEA